MANPFNVPNRPGHVYIEAAPALTGVPFRKIVKAIKRGDLVCESEGQIAVAELRRWIQSLPTRGRPIYGGSDYAVTAD